MGRAATKDSQLQIRVTLAQKRAIRRQAARAGMSLSEWLLSRALPPPEQRFRELVAELAGDDDPGFAVAELLDWLDALPARDFERVTAERPDTPLSDYWANQLAATLEHAAARKDAAPPAWTREIPPLAEPAFGSELASLRLHLLLAAPPAFATRNLFVDTSVGGRV